MRFGACAIALTFFALLPAGAATVNVNPTYAHVVADAQWTAFGSEYRVPSSANKFTNENLELPVEGDKWAESGGFLVTTSGKYFEFLDLVETKWGADDCYLYISWEVAGDGFWLNGGYTPNEGYLADFNAYFGIQGKEDIAVSMNSGGADILGTTFSVFNGVLGYRDTNNDVPGPGGDVSNLSIIGQGGDGFDTEIPAAVFEARRNGNVIEIAMELDSMGLTSADFQLLDYVRIATAQSNAAEEAVLFVNDHFNLNGDSLMVDTSALPGHIPEPSQSLLLFLSAFALLGRRKR